MVEQWAVVQGLFEADNESLRPALTACSKLHVNSAFKKFQPFQFGLIRHDFMLVERRFERPFLSVSLFVSPEIHVLLGTVANMIFNKSTFSITLQSSNGILCRVGGLAITKFSSSISMCQVVEMNDKWICKLAEPIDAKEAASMRYVDTSICDASGISASTVSKGKGNPSIYLAPHVM
jgi:hypothetical protein